MTVYSYCNAWANEKDRLYEPCKQLWWSRQCLGMGIKHVLFKGLSAAHLDIAFRYTRTRELSKLIRFKTGN